MTDATTSAERPVVFWAMIGGTLAMIVVAWGLAALLGAPFPGALSWSAADAAIGVGATVPLCLLLWWFMGAKARAVAEFRETQIDHFRSVGFAFTPPRIALIALAAGVSEEILFRGVLQGYAAAHLPIAAALLLPNLLFGLLHARTALYALIAGVVGCWLGVVYAYTNNLLAPIVAHALYDVVALEVTRRAIAGRVAPQPREDVDSGSSVTG